MRPIACAHLPRRVFWLCAGVFLSGTGIALLVKANIGSSSVASFSYVCTCIWPAVSLGTFTFLLNLALFCAQFVVERGSFTPEKLLQLVPTAMMGLAADVNMYLMRGAAPSGYPQQVFALLAGCLMFALSISLMVASRLILMPMDTLITLLSRKSHRAWGNVKTTLDMGLLLLAVLLSLGFLGRIEGVREGTIVAAVCVGQFCRLLQRPADLLVWGRSSNPA